MRHQLINGTLLGLFVCLPGMVAALTSDREQPIQIEADRMTIDEKQGVSVYQGRVNYVQGSIRMSADKVTIYSRGGEFQRFEAEGERVRYRQLLDNDEGELLAKARMIDYHAGQENILLQGNAHVTRGEDEFSGSRIEYDVKSDTVKAQMATNGGERVQVVIQPRQESTATAVDDDDGK